MKQTGLIALLASLGLVAGGVAGFFASVEKIADSPYRPAMRMEVEAAVEPIRTRSARSVERLDQVESYISCEKCIQICERAQQGQDCRQLCRELGSC